MIAVSGNARVFLHQGPVDLRKGHEGLSCMVKIVFDVPLTSGAYFAFMNRPRNRIKVLYWDSDGLAIWFKRLEKGTFTKRYFDRPELERREFLMLLEGVIPRRLQSRFKM